MGDWKDILSNEEERVNEDELMKYLEGDLSEEEKYAFEKKTTASDFNNDALEGLLQFKNKNNLDDYVKQLNKNLHEQLNARKQRFERRRLKDNPWFLLSIIIILGICILTYIVIQTYNNRSATPIESRKELKATEVP